MMSALAIAMVLTMFGWTFVAVMATSGTLSPIRVLGWSVLALTVACMLGLMLTA